MFRGAPAPKNPWRATTLEWSLPSPVTLHGNFEKTPTVYHGPYEYSVPGLSQDWLPQYVPMSAMPKHTTNEAVSLEH